MQGNAPIWCHIFFNSAFPCSSTNKAEFRCTAAVWRGCRIISRAPFPHFTERMERMLKKTHFSFSFKVLHSWKKNLGDVSYEYNSILYRLYNDCCFHTLITVFAQLFYKMDTSAITDEITKFFVVVQSARTVIIMCLCAQENNLWFGTLRSLQFMCHPTERINSQFMLNPP